MSYNTELQNNNQELRGILEDVNELPSYPNVPTKTSELENDSGFITKVVNDLANYYTKSQTFTREEVNAKISSIPKFAIEVVSSLPTSNISATTVYLVGGGSGNDLYTEYIYANGKWEILGAQTVDLTGYATETWVNTQLGSYIKQSELEAAIESALASIPDWAKQSSKPGYNANEVGAVAYTAQSLTEKQKAQARENIGALDVSQKDNIVGEILTIIGTPIAGTIGDNNVITLGGDLAEGTYTLRWFNQNGYAQICTLSVDENGVVTPPDTPDTPDEPEEIKNWLYFGTTEVGGTELYNGIGYKDGTRWSASGKKPSNTEATACYLTGIIPVTEGDTVYTCGLAFESPNSTQACYFVKYGSDGSIVADNITSYSNIDSNGVASFTIPSGVVAFRLMFYDGVTASSIITINQYPI